MALSQRENFSMLRIPLSRLVRRITFGRGLSGRETIVSKAHVLRGLSTELVDGVKCGVGVRCFHTAESAVYHLLDSQVLSTDFRNVRHVRWQASHTTY
jgi:hypothetical protein